MNNPLNNEELTKLNNYLSKLTSSIITNMDLLNGLLVAVVWSPKVILPQKFIVEIMPNEDTGADTSECIALIIRHWKNIRHMLDKGHSYEAIMPSKNMCSTCDWADGFIKGMGFDIVPWVKLLYDEHHGHFMLPILAAEHEDKYCPVLASTPRKAAKNVLLEEELDKLLESISTSVKGIYNYFKLRKIQDTMLEN